MKILGHFVNERQIQSVKDMKQFLDSHMTAWIRDYTKGDDETFTVELPLSLNRAIDIRHMLVILLDVIDVIGDMEDEDGGRKETLTGDG